MTKIELVGNILQRVGALGGDAELSKMLGQLMSEISTESDESASKAAGKYVVCIEATLPDGTKVQHPLVGGYLIPNNIDEIGMMVGDNLVNLQRENEALTRAVESAYPQVHVRYVPVSDDALSSLEDKLKTLLTSLSEAIDAAATAKQKACGLMNVDVNVEDISDEMLQDIMAKTMYAGAALTEDGKVVDREDGVKYDEEVAIENRDDESDYDEDEDGYDEDEEEGDYDEED